MNDFCDVSGEAQLYFRCFIRDDKKLTMRASLPTRNAIEVTLD